MQIADILRVKGNILYTVPPSQTLSEAAAAMAEKDIGSLVVMDAGKVVGILTFREVIKATVANGGKFEGLLVEAVMDKEPLTCDPSVQLDEIRLMMVERHARYMPVLRGAELLGVVSFYDVAKAVVESQSFENQMLKAYINDWPASGQSPAKE